MRCTNGLPDKQTVGYTLLEQLPYPASFRPINSADSRAATVIS